MSEQLAEKNIKEPVDIQYEQYLHQMKKISIIGFAALDTAAFISLEIIKRPITQEIGKMALATTALAFAPLAFAKVSDSVKDFVKKQKT